jgi:hypothetical protein
MWEELPYIGKKWDSNEIKMNIKCALLETRIITIPQNEVLGCIYIGVSLSVGLLVLWFPDNNSWMTQLI